MSDAPVLATLPRLDPAGRGAMLRVLLPPNLPAAAGRDAIAIRFELAIAQRGRMPPDRARGEGPLAIPPAQQSALFLLETWNHGPVPSLAQLTRAQLGALLAVLNGEPVFFRADRPEPALAWKDGVLPGVSEHLQPPASPAASSGVPARSPVSSSSETARRNPPTRTAATVSNATPALVDGSEHFLAIQLPAREHPSYAPLLELLKNEGFRLEPSNRKWWLRDRHRTLDFLARCWRRLETDWQARFTDNFRRQTNHLGFASIACELQRTGDEFQVTLGLKAGAAGERAVAEALTGGRRYVEAAGRVVLLDDERLARLHEAQRALGGSHDIPLLARSSHRVAAARIGETDALLGSLSPELQTPEEWRRRTAIFRHPGSLTPAPAAPGIDAHLRPYQRLGAAWMWHLRAAGLGGILADEMGLGKTLQALTVISARHRSSSHSDPCLVVCPASLLENWRREAARFAPELRVRVHHGGGRTAEAAALREADLVVTSYGTLARDADLFRATAWDTFFADEAQHVKNRRTQHAQALQGLRAPGRFLLTGTPVENSLADLESLFAIILPGHLAPIPAEVRGEERAWHEARVRQQSAPYILRRTKAQVTPELPPKIEQTLFVEMTEGQRELYEAVRASTESELMRLQQTGRSEAQIRFAIFTQLLRLRQICGDPRLIDRAREAADSAKLAALLELCDEALDDGHRLLVFSQFTSLLALVRSELEARGIGYCYLDGSLSPRERQAEVDRFNGDSSVPLFLLSLKAGGSGLNLASADVVVHLDPWWNPAVEAQATDRAHRIGQTRVVTSYKLIAAGTVEERVLALQQQKRGLLADVFEASEAANAALSIADLEALVGR